MTIKVATPEQMKCLRWKSSMEARKLSPVQAHAQMQRNGSISTPNPWYNSKATGEGSLTFLPAKP